MEKEKNSYKVEEKVIIKTEKKGHSCLYPSEYEESGKKYQVNCIGKIKGKVLSAEKVPDKHDNSNEKCWKIRINEWKNLRFNKEFVIWYGPENYDKRPFPEVEKTYWFFLHEVKGIGHEYNQHGWQWTHDWQLIEDESESKMPREENIVQQEVPSRKEIDKKEESERKSLFSNKQERTGKRTEREFSYSPLKKEVLATKRVVKVTKGGRRFSFTALLLVKDESKQAIAFANAGGKEMMAAFRKSSHKAQKKLINYFPPQQTIPRGIEVNYRGVTILLKPAPPGTGVKAGSVLNILFKFLEIKDISATIICSRRKRKNKPVVIRAAFMALDKLTGKKYNY